MFLIDPWSNDVASQFVGAGKSSADLKKAPVQDEESSTNDSFFKQTPRSPIVAGIEHIRTHSPLERQTLSAVFDFLTEDLPSDKDESPRSRHQ
ncbi:hypothetical protein [Rhodopirellula baltica]|uniref:Uncharacterized protein n=1 Tax=Rhodopirellula baltica SWK14 TaxID=993516 RepID=L7CKM1_RHOBT|nr:hypothetical protein [Rhodopirellula baltica]ELP34508.1 hypothetical protein RBSWK_01518 [Rhodopirellula baltica SWK14]